MTGFDGRDRDTAFGHSGMGGSLALYDAETDVAIAITVNKLTLEREFMRVVSNHIAQETGMGVVIELD